MSIGVAITVHNRHLTALNTIKAWRSLMPRDSKLVVVDDASEPPIPNADFRFEKNAGISKAKNKCIELLEDCEHIFMSDDDCFPIREDWFRPYINSGHTHLSLTFDKTANGISNGRKRICSNNGIVQYTKPCGCLLYIHKSVIDKVGGFDEGYGKWGMEHVDFSNRAFNAGASKLRYADIDNSLTFFRSLDYERSVKSSTPCETKRRFLKFNRARFEARKKSKEYIPYKRPQTSSESVVIASYFNYARDPQRKTVWDDDINKVLPLKESVEGFGHKCIILHNCFETDDPDFHKIEPDIRFTPNAFRWKAQQRWIEANMPEKVFMVDSTDVIMLKDPFDEIEKGFLYAGYEQGNNMANRWMIHTQGKHLKIRDWMPTIHKNRSKPLLNCGVFGGYTNDVIEFLERLVAYHDKFSVNLKTSSDMSMFNYVALKYFWHKIVTGEQVTTIFKQNETNDISWWKHK